MGALQDGRTPLFIAALQGNESVAQVLLQAGANKVAKNEVRASNRGEGRVGWIRHLSHFLDVSRTPIKSAQELANLGPVRLIGAHGPASVPRNQMTLSLVTFDSFPRHVYLVHCSVFRGLQSSNRRFRR